MATGLAVTAGFLGVFVAAGGGLILGIRVLSELAPWLAVAIGAALVVVGARVIVGLHLGVAMRRSGAPAPPPRRP